MKISVLIAIVFFSVTSLASLPTAITVSKINLASRQVTVASDKKIVGEVGDFLEIGDRCPLEIVSNHGTTARLSLDACETPELVKLGSSVNNPIAGSPAPTAKITDSTLREKMEWNSKPTEFNLARGFRFSLLKSFFSGDRRLRSSDNTMRVNQNLGVSLGYTDVVRNEVGSSYQLAYSEFEDNELASLRFEASMTYGFNSNSYFLGGLNLHKFTRGLDSLEVMPGAQLGVGLQFTKNYGLIMTYYQMNHRESSGTETLPLGGLEFALNATFE